MAEDRKPKIRQLLRRGDFSNARAQSMALCEENPNDPEAWCFMSTVHRLLGEFSEAETACKGALLKTPNHQHLNFNLGIALAQQSKFREAVEYLNKVVQLNPAHADAWSYLAHTSQACGQIDKAIAAWRTASQLQPESAEVRTALLQLFIQQELWANAANAAIPLLKLAPSDSNALTLAGIAFSRSYQYDRMLQEIEPIAKAHPDNTTANYYVAIAYMELAQMDEAELYFQRVLEIEPMHVESRSSLASIQNFRGDHEEAYATITPLLEFNTDSLIVSLTYAQIAPRFGESDKAIELLRSNIDRAGILAFNIAKMEVALAKLYEAKKDYETAFKYYKRGNQNAGVHFNREEHLNSIRVLKNVFSSIHTRSLPTTELTTNQPIFVVGMPRSGTSLVEQIIASHPEAFGAGELKYIQNYIYEIDALQPSGKRYPDCMLNISKEILLDKANDYLHQLNRLSHDSAHVVDKMPINFQYLNMIYQLFPNAKILHTVRDPMDTCMSCYCQFFSGAYPYTFDLADLGFFYRSYEYVMALWKQTLPLSILDVQYENLVQNQEAVTRQVIEFCGLKWSDQCLEFHKTKRAVATASTDQVRQPMYKNAIGKWKRYDKHLEKLKIALTTKLSI